MDKMSLHLRKCARREKLQPGCFPVSGLPRGAARSPHNRRMISNQPSGILALQRSEGNCGGILKRELEQKLIERWPNRCVFVPEPHARDLKDFHAPCSDHVPARHVRPRSSCAHWGSQGRDPQAESNPPGAVLPPTTQRPHPWAARR